MKVAFAILLALAMPIAPVFAATGGKMDANFLLLCIATVLWGIAAFPWPAPWATYHGNAIALGLVFFGLSLIVA